MQTKVSKDLQWRFLGLVVERMLLVVAEHLKHDWLILDVVDERPRHVDGEVLYVIKTERGTFSGVLQRLRRKCLIMAMQEVELAENVRVFGCYAGSLQHGDSEGEGRSDLDVVGKFVDLDGLEEFLLNVFITIGQFVVI